MKTLADTTPAVVRRMKEAALARRGSSGQNRHPTEPLMTAWPRAIDRLVHRLATGRLTGILGGMILRADVARDAGHTRDAAILYGAALRLDPDNGAIHLQCGHMFKEAGDLVSAEAHYRAALRLLPHDPDAALQWGHFLKVAGRGGEAAAAYREALRLNPGWDEPAAEIAAIEGSQSALRA